MKKTRFVPLYIMVMLTCFEVQAQLKTNTAILQNASIETARKEKSDFQRALSLAKQKNWPLSMRTRNGGRALLVGVDFRGLPRYVTTNDNIISAATIKTNLLWPGGSTGLNLSGSSANMKGKLAIWDGGKVRGTHVELAGRVVQKDNASVIDDHATHTSGTLIASGVNPLAKGMSFGAQQLLAYDFNNDVSEMLGESPNLLVSNHSYGAIAGWNFNTDVTPNRWEFWGNAGDTVDYNFGYYDDETQMWDSIAYNAPYYLIVKSGGNNHGDGDAVAVGQPYWRFNASGIMANAGNRPAGISSDDGFDNLPTYSCAKNILTLGAVNPIPGGYNQVSDVVIANFSSWGPTDDGRIKPDVVTDGVNVLSSYGTSDNAYATLSGTSMSSPAAAGSIFLLQEYYSKLHSGVFVRSATVKGLVIHTADEAGPAPGPDYVYGWGLINMQKAASVITSDTMAVNPDQKIYENNLINGGSFTLNIVASGKGPLVATICWTDPKATVDEVNVKNNPARKLVNDLDLRITSGTTTYQPWILDRNNPGNAATTGDDSINNVEKIVINNPVPGQAYTIKITHKGTLQRGAQAYSLLISGIGGQAYCASAATSSAGTRIDSVIFSNIKNANPAGCTTYANYTNLTGQIQPNQILPISIKLSSCDASVANKVVKVYIDFNNNGTFTDAGENVAQSAVLNGNATFNANISIPAGLTVGSFTVMRIVAEETSNPAVVVPCGSYGNGETQDYRLEVVSPSNDAGVTGIVSPIGSSCANDSQLVSVMIRNLGSSPLINVPINTRITNGATTVANLSFTYPDTIAANESIVYTYQTTFNAIAGNTYTITSRTNLPGDQDTTNDQSSTIFIATSGTGVVPTGIVEQCGPSEVYLKSTVADTTNVAFWYDSDTATAPIAIGNDTSSNVITPNHTYYLSLNDENISIGPAKKSVFPSGGYNTFNGNYIAFTNTAPVTIVSARLYIGNAGTINFIVADTSDYDPTTGVFSYLVVSSNTINVYPTTPTPPTLGTNINSAADTGAVFYLNLPVPETGNHLIIVDCENGASIFRNNSIASNPYPFTSPGGIFSITNNSAFSATNPFLYQQYYYFFYDMKIQLANCASSRAPIVATQPTAPVISLIGNILSSTGALHYQWYLNGSAIPNATKQTDTAIASGVYTVVAADSLGCTQTSNQINYSSTGSGDISLNVYPNPGNGQFILQFQTATTADLNITITNTLGQIVYQADTYAGFTGVYNKQIDVNYLASGMYFVKVLLGNKPYVKKLIIAR